MNILSFSDVADKAYEIGGAPLFIIACIFLLYILFKSKVGD